MDLKLVKNILDLIAESDVDQVSIEEGDFKIKVKKTAELETPPASVMPPMQYQMPAAPSAAGAQPQPQSVESREQPVQEEKADEPIGQVVKSPIVGTFYRAPSPDDDPFVQVGDQVEKGQTLCIVEAMKIMNEIDSEFSGEVKKILVEDGEAIEFEQPLFEIE